MPRGARRWPHAARQARRSALMSNVNGALIAVIVAAIVVFIIIMRTAVVVPQQSAYVVERLGRFHSILEAGFHILTPFVDSIRYRHSLKETAIDIPAQVCITRD